MKYSSVFSHPGVTAVSALNKNVLVSCSAFVLTKEEVNYRRFAVPDSWEKLDHSWQRNPPFTSSYIFTELSI